MTPATERRLLQAAFVLGGCVPVLAGLLGMLRGSAMTGVPLSGDGAAIALDSHVRYLSGLLFAIGTAFWMSVPRIERHTSLVRLLTAIVFVGGLARLYGLSAGVPATPMLFGLVMELIVTPALCLWQARIARRLA